MSLGTDAADAVAADAVSTSASRGAADRLHPVARSLGPALLILLAQVVVFPAPGAIMLRGLIVGGLTALVALGMALVYRANRIVNFAQADLGFAPTVVAYLLLTESGVPYPVAVGIGLALAVATGALTERFVIRRFAKSPRLLVTIATIGLSQLLAAVALLAPRLWDVQLIAGRVDPPFDLTRRVGSLTFDANDFLALVATPIAVALIGAFLRGSDAGVAIRASADSAARASLLGVPVARLQTLVWSVAAALAFVAVFLRSGILELPSGTALGFSILFRALAALLLGRMTDLVGVTSAALALGVLELGVEWNHGFELIDPVLGLVIVVALVVRRRESAGMARADVSAWHAGEAVRPVPAALAALPVVKAARWGALGLVAVVAVVLPHLLPADDVFRASAVLIYAILGVSLVLLSGWAGTVSLGQVAFFAIGAAVAGAAIVSWDIDLFPALLLASVVGALAAVIVGIPTLRLRGLYLAVTTFALALATTSYLLNDDYFGWVPSDERVVRPPFLGGIEASSEVQVYYLALIVLALVMLGMKGVRSGRFGRALVALRDNERAAQAYAVDAARTQLAAFALSGTIAALAGGLFVHHEQAFDSTSYSPIENLAVFTMVVLGGMGSLAGAVLGALFLLGGRWFLDTDWQFVASGLGVLAILLAAPSGLAGLLYRARDAWLRTVARGRGLDVPAYSTSSTDITPPSFAGPEPASPSPPSVAGSEPVSPSSPSVAGPEPVSPSPPSVAGSEPVSPSSPSVAGSEPVSPSSPSVAGSEPVSPSSPSVAGPEPASTSSPSVAGSAPASPTPATVPGADAAIGLGPEGSASPSTDPAEAARPVDRPTGGTPVVAASLGAGSDRPEGEAAEAGAQGVDVSLPAANGSRGGSNGAAGEWLLDVRDVEAGYGGVPVLFGVDLAVRAGEAVALLGTNGAGKSTLLNAISGLAPPTAGRVLVGGDDLTGRPAHVVAAHGVAQMPGGKGTFPTLTVAENMRVASWLRRGDRDGLAADVDRLQKLFPVLRERASQPAGSLSGGQQQMLALAMSVLTKPRLLMIDELSLGLAPVVVGDLLQFVAELRADGTTLVIVEQSVNVALEATDRAVFLERGQVLFTGPAADLLDRPELLRSVFLGAITPAATGPSVASPSATSAPPSGKPGTPAAAAGVPGEGSQARPNDFAAAHSATAGVARGAGGSNAASFTSSAQGGASGGTAGAAGPAIHAAERAVMARGGEAGGPAEGTGVLEVHGLSVAFGGVHAVEDVSFDVASGEVVGVIGPNGAGKTTLFDLLSGFVPPSAGRVVLAGRDVTTLNASDRARRGLGRSFQDARLFASMTVEEAIAVALERWTRAGDPLSAAFHLPNAVDDEHRVRRRVDQLVGLLGLERFRSLFVGELSTGTRRIVDLACLLAHRPRVVLLDEPASGIAQREVEQLAPLIRRIRDETGASLVVVEHDIPLVEQVADRIVAMDQGRVVAVGPPAAVLSDPAVLRSYVGEDHAAIRRSGTRAEARPRSETRG